MKFDLRTLAGLLASALLAACGGGGGGAADTAPLALAASTTPVRVEGCALDAGGPARALAVTVSDAGGRVLASALTDADGVWRLHVPPQQVLHFATATPGGDGLTLLSASTSMTLSACLRTTA